MMKRQTDRLVHPGAADGAAFTLPVASLDFAILVKTCMRGNNIGAFRITTAETYIGVLLWPIVTWIFIMIY